MAADTSVKVSPETKRGLDELQAFLTRESGQKVTLQALQAALVDLGREEQDRLLAAFADRAPALSKAQVDRVLSRSFDFPLDVAPEELDDLVYGFPHGGDAAATPGARRLAARLRKSRAARPAAPRQGRRKRRRGT